CMQGLEFLYSF
nr:immunoglobulin light chain junction region [Macaca mulatta]